MKNLLFAIFICLSASASAQLYKLSELDTLRQYTSLEEALQNPQEVIRLNLKGKKLKTVPDEVFLLTNLQELNLKKTRIEKLPAQIGLLSQLQILDLSKNSIESLPPEIGKLSNLKIFRASENELQHLPIEIGNLSELRFLDIWSNNLEGLPDEITQLEKLKKIDMRVIQFSEKKQKYIQTLLPNTEILFSQSCNCD